MSIDPFASRPRSDTPKPERPAKAPDAARWVCKYLGGLPVGKPNQLTTLSLPEDLEVLRIERKGFGEQWQFDMPLDAVRGVTVDTAESATFKRMLAVGILALAWKKKEYYLGVEYQTEGDLDGAAVFHARHDDLEKLRQALVKRRTKLAEPAAVSNATQSGDPVKLLQQLAELRDQGVLTSEEFDAKKSEILARI